LRFCYFFIILFEILIRLGALPSDRIKQKKHHISTRIAWTLYLSRDEAWHGLLVGSQSQLKNLSTLGNQLTLAGRLQLRLCKMI
jgi:hypothetical protein